MVLKVFKEYERLGLVYDLAEITIFHSIQCDNGTFEGIQPFFIFFSQ